MCNVIYKLLIVFSYLTQQSTWRYRLSNKTLTVITPLLALLSWCIINSFSHATPHATFKAPETSPSTSPSTPELLPRCEGLRLEITFNGRDTELWLQVVNEIAWAVTRIRDLCVTRDKTVLSKWMWKDSLVAFFAWISQFCEREKVPWYYIID